MREDYSAACWCKGLFQKLLEFQPSSFETPTAWAPQDEGEVFEAASNRCGTAMSATMKRAKSCAISGSALRSVRLRAAGMFWSFSIIYIA